MTFSFADILVIAYIFLFFFLSYKWMESIKKYQTILRIFWWIFYTACLVWLIPTELIDPDASRMNICIVLLLPVVYTIASSYTRLSRYSKYMDEGIYSLSVFLLIMLWFGIMGDISEYRYDSTWTDLHFWQLSSLWIFAHIPFFISLKNRKWFFHRFYIFPVVMIIINLLFIIDTNYEIILWSYGVFFTIYIGIIVIGKYMQRHFERK